MQSNDEPRADVLIVGGGLSGTLLAAQLLRQARRYRLLIVEPRAELGRGEAYSAVELGHTLNGNAARMSVDPDNPDDLTQWLQAHLAAGGWPQAAEQAVLERLLASGRLRIHAAALQGVEAGEQGGVAIRVRPRGQRQTLRIDGAALINSTGIEYDWRRVDRPLPQNLLKRGLIRPGPLALGIAADAQGAVSDAHGQPSARLFAMGPPLRGMWWESTAVTDVALQAKALAQRLAYLLG